MANSAAQENEMLIEDAVTRDASKDAAMRRDHIQTRSYCRGFIMTLLVTVSALFILFILVHAVSLPATTSTQSLGDQPVLPPEVFDGDFKIQLHPERHRTRSPVTSHYVWNITNSITASDGVYKTVILINGEFPGPTIEARSGDTLVINVLNSLTEGISVHWHGLHMNGANDMDGPAGINQCSIPPRQAFTYQIPIGEQVGTFWYHAHSEVQRADGLYGGLVVHNPSENETVLYGYDNELLFMVGDWYHRAANTVMAEFLDQSNEGHEPFPDSLLINGRGYFDCTRLRPSAQLNCIAVAMPCIHLDKTLRHRVRLINVGILTGITVTVADAELSAVQVDGGRRIASHPSNAIGILYPAQRVDFVMQWPLSSADTKTEIVIDLDDEYLLQTNPSLDLTQAFIVYGTSNATSVAASTPNITTFDLQNAKGPQLPTALPEPDQHYMIYTVIEILAHNNFVPQGHINHTAWVPQNSPLLTLPREQWDNHQLVPWTGNKPVWVELTINNIDTQGHPFHLHGFDFYVIASYEGKGGWDYYNPFIPLKPPRGGPFNLHDPIIRDTVYVPPYGYVVLRFLADNEGIWVLHCHILWHQASGMSMAFQVLGSGDGLTKTRSANHARQVCAEYGM